MLPKSRTLDTPSLGQFKDACANNLFEKLLLKNANNPIKKNILCLKHVNFIPLNELVVGGWWLVVGGWWLVVGGWWLVVDGWWLVVYIDLIRDVLFVGVEFIY